MGEEDVFKKLAERINNEELAQRIQKYVENEPAERLFRIPIYPLADVWQVARRDMLSAFIFGVQVGLFDLHWDFHCPRCNGIAESHDALKESTSENFCPICNVNFRNVLDQTVEVSFSVSDRVHPIPDDVKSTFMEKMREEIMEKEHFERKEDMVTGLDCFNNPVFREVFADDVLSVDESLQIKHMALLFTDIRGSTSLYEKLGDPQAYRLVREHFKVLFDKVNAHEGAIVKTIGDAVMASFSRNEQALSAALEMQKSFKSFNDRVGIEDAVEIKVGIHAGPSIAVNLNDRIDYFGTTVNMAARIQGLAKGGEILISGEIFSCPNCKEIISRYVRKIQKYKTELRGLSGKYTVYRIAFN